MEVAFFDNGGKTADRYTAVFMQEIDPIREPNVYGARTMSDNANQPNGVCMWVEITIGDHLGEEITFSELPEVCQRIVLRDWHELQG